MKFIRSFILGSCLIVMFLLPAAAPAATVPVHITVKSAPRNLIAGRTHTFELEIENRGKKPFTYSLIPGFKSIVCWDNDDRSGGCSGVSGGSGRFSIGTNYDPVTGKFECVYSRYNASDFVTLQPKERRKFEVKVEAPSDVEVSRASARVFFTLESDEDGVDLGLKAWKGKIEKTYKLPLIKETN